MDFVIDGVLILTCLSAGFYCFLLSRRLRRFADTKSGIGAQIVSLNAALEEMRAAMPALKRDVEEAAESLSKKIAQSQKIKAEIQRKVEQLEHAADEMAKVAAKRSQPRSVLDQPVAGYERQDVDVRENFGDAPSRHTAAPEIEQSGILDDDGEYPENSEQRLGFTPDIEDGQNMANSHRGSEGTNENMLSVERMLL